MISFTTARSLVENEILKMGSHTSPERRIIIDDNATLEKEFGWVFFYNTKAFLETNDMDFALIGNAPIIVDKEDGSIHFTGTGRSIDEYILEFLEEKKRGK